MNDTRNVAAIQRNHADALTDDAVLQCGATVYSVAQARDMVAQMARVSASKDADAFGNAFTEDCVVCFIQAAPLIGRKALRDYMASRLTPDRLHYTCEKTLRTLNGNVFGVQWTNTWTEKSTGKNIRTRGMEFWIMRGDLAARWDGAQNFWEE